MAELVSVIIPVYNAAEFVKASVESILNQTYRELEIIIVNDGSTDNSAEILNSFSDPRIKLFHIKNGGVASALNYALLHATGKYIARQDADDVSMPNRIKLLVDFMQKNPQHGLVAGAAQIMDAAGAPKGTLRHATGNAKLQYDILWDSPFVSSTTLFRSACLDATGNFHSSKDFFEDYDMWSKIASQYKIANLPEILLNYRELSTGLSFTTSNSIERVVNQRRKNIAAAFPSLDKEIVEGLALCGKRRTRIASLAQLKRIFRMIVAHFEALGATGEEMNLIRADLAERMNTFRWMTGENKNALYYPGRMLEKIFYPKK